MGKSRDISEEKSMEIQNLLSNTNYTQKKIAAMTNVSKSVVSRISFKLRHQQPIINKRKGQCGRKRKTSPHADSRIRDICVRNRKRTALDLTKMVHEAGVEVSTRTISRRLAEEGLTRYPRKARATSDMLEKRLQAIGPEQRITGNSWLAIKRMRLKIINEPK